MTSRAFFSGLVALLVSAATACSGDPGAAVSDGAGGDMPGGGSPPAASDPAASTPDDGTNATLTVKVEGTGRVTSQPAGIDCPGKCTATFAKGTNVTLTSAPAEGWRFGAWKGACSGASCAIAIAEDSTVTGSLSLIDARWDPAVGADDCKAAWGTAGEKLSPCDTVKDDYVVVHKSKRNVALCASGKLVKNLRSGLGFAPSGDKVEEGDGKTPEGVFYVPTLVPNSSYYKAFLISYPTLDDAQRGFTSGLITSAQRTQIQSAHAACVAPPQDTPLGGEVELHGNGSSQDWTFGCVALDDSGIDLLWATIGKGDSIVVLP